MLKIVTIFVSIAGILIILRLALKAWRRADIKEKIEKIEDDAHLNAKISAIDPEDAQENKKHLANFLLCLRFYCNF